MPRHVTHRYASLGAILVCLVALSPPVLLAHEVRPAYLELSEVPSGRVEVRWKQPLLPSGDPELAMRLPLTPKFSNRCTPTDRAVPEVTETALLERWVMTCTDGGMQGITVEIEGLPRTLTDVLLRVRWQDGTAVDHLLRPDAPRVRLSEETAGGLGVPTYLRLGVEHLLFGFDHILFVVGLTFFVRKPRQLVQVVTAFTVAHSITLALSTLGVLTLSQRPVEAVIALSILFLAVELIQDAETEPSLMRRWPWAIAFGFGLLHGFGFAGALSEIGLPEEARAMALFLFNAGVEIGQLLVVGVLLAIVRLFRVSPLPLPAAAVQLPIYVMGVVSAYWFIDRVVSIVPTGW